MVISTLAPGNKSALERQCNYVSSPPLAQDSLKQLSFMEWVYLRDSRDQTRETSNVKKAQRIGDGVFVKKKYVLARIAQAVKAELSK